MARDLPKPLVILMVKAPRPGRVKSRLAKQIGASEALRFYRVTTARLIRSLWRDPRWRLAIAVTPDADRNARFWPAAVPRFPQGGGALGVRMVRLLSRSFRHPVVVIGSDIPGIKPSHIADALRKLTGSNVVLGPAPDGGYWLIARGAGARPFRRSVFDNVRWSTAYAMADTVAAWGGPVDYALQLPDVDTISDYRQWRANA
jgi:rSAM/selenodomain-associated transferase 1